MGVAVPVLMSAWNSPPTDAALVNGRAFPLVRSSKSIANIHTDCPSQVTSTMSGCSATWPTSAISLPSGSLMIWRRPSSATVPCVSWFKRKLGAAILSTLPPRHDRHHPDVYRIILKQRLGSRAGYGAGSRVVPIPTWNYHTGRKARPCCADCAYWLAHGGRLTAGCPAFLAITTPLPFRDERLIRHSPKCRAACAIAHRHRQWRRRRLRLTASGHHARELVNKSLIRQ